MYRYCYTDFLCYGVHRIGKSLFLFSFFTLGPYSDLSLVFVASHCLSFFRFLPLALPLPFASFSIYLPLSFTHLFYWTSLYSLHCLSFPIPLCFLSYFPFAISLSFHFPFLYPFMLFTSSFPCIPFFLHFPFTFTLLFPFLLSYLFSFSPLSSLPQLFTFSFHFPLFFLTPYLSPFPFPAPSPSSLLLLLHLLCFPILLSHLFNPPSFLFPFP